MPSPLRTQTVTRIRANLQIPSSSTLITSADIETIIQENLEGEFTRNAPYILVESMRGADEAKMPLPSRFDIESSVINEIHQKFRDTKAVLHKNCYATQQVDLQELEISDLPLAGATSAFLTIPRDAFEFVQGDLVKIFDETPNEEINWIVSSDENTGEVVLKNPTVNAYNMNPKIMLQNFIDFGGAGVGRIFSINELFHVEYTAEHIHSDTESTIAKKDYDAFVALCKSGACFAMASKFTQKTISSFRADSVDHSGLSGQWEERGNKFRKVFEDHFGITEANRVTAGAAMKHIQFSQTWGAPINRPWMRS